MHAKIRWTLVGMITCLVGVFVFGSARPRSTPTTAPRLLPIDGSARPLAEATSGNLLPNSHRSLEFDTLTGDDRSSIRPASHLTVVPFVVAPSMLGTNGPRIIEIRETVGGEDFVWNVLSTDPIRLRQRTITVRVSADAIDGFRIATKPVTENYKLVQQDGIFESTITLPATPRQYELQLSKEDVLPVSTVTVRLPNDLLPEPQISGVSNNEFKDADPQDQDTALENVRVYGRYLSVSGTFSDGFIPDRRDLKFVLFEKRSDNLLGVAPEQPELGELTVDQNGLWTATLRLPRLRLHEDWTILVHARRGEDHRYARRKITFNVQSDRVRADAPSITKITQIGGGDLTLPGDNPRNEVWLVPTKDFRVTGSTSLPANSNLLEDSHIVLYMSRGEVRTQVANTSVKAGDGKWEVELKDVGAGEYHLEAQIVQGDMRTPPSPPVRIRVRTTGPRVVVVEPANRLFGPGRIVLTIRFNPENPLHPDGAENKENYQLTGPGIGDDNSLSSPSEATFNSAENSVTLTFADFAAEGEFTVLIKKTPNGGTPFRDIFGHPIQTDSELGHSFTIIKSTLATTPTAAPGITQAGRAPYVPYQEFTEPRDVPVGFNPHDKVETRVVRLYYYRDAHRVAQIINRRVQSYNRQRVDVQHQLADRARQDADQRMVARQRAEREAIMKAQEARRVERELESVQQQINRAVQELTNARRQPEPDPQVVNSLDSVIRSLTTRANHLQNQVQTARGEAARTNEAAQEAEAQETLAREAQFRREVAAAREDPDTFAPGVPESNDPVEQVSVSVIGEGLIHLRGPLKGINTIRTMIDQIDQPVGQVRVAVHTVQINGERQNRMEDVANIIQMYLDHSRFLTMQSSEMLRKAVVQVASRKAEEAMALYPGDSQRDRDRRYLDAFFGREFIDELEAMDSEFLRTGNKILSLHSMDTTSLSSALNLLALAKNSTRLEILAEFEQMTQGELPMIEAMYMEAAMTVCRQKWSMRHPPTFYPMAHRATFQSLKGFFNAQIAHDETLTPLQREFTRLAQIFKSRLITEMEYKQRVMERALIEERGGDREDELQGARDKEEMAIKALNRAEMSLRTAQRQLQSVMQTVHVRVGGPLAQVMTARDAAKTSKERIDNLIKSIEGSDWLFGPGGVNAAKRAAGTQEIALAYQAAFDEGWRRMLSPLGEADDLGQRIRNYRSSVIRVDQMEDPYLKDDLDQSLEFDLPWESRCIRIRIEPNNALVVVKADDKAFLRRETGAFLSKASQVRKALGQFALDDSTKKRGVRADAILQRLLAVDLAEADGNRLINMLHRCMTMFELYLQVTEQILEATEKPIADFGVVVARIETDTTFTGDLRKIWTAAEHQLNHSIGAELLAELRPMFQSSREAIHSLLIANREYLDARGHAENSRRPLDHRKFLDMLIDDLEEKYIELLDGTRAHTANVDNYLKRLTTALDDDFNTQFYFPAFRYIREASTHWDVQFGQVETTSILANNRAFAKVDPSASMEFDLPARSIAIAEALNGAKALIDDVGALANDPSFLALASSGIVAPANISPGGAGGFGVVRDVLPGLDSTTAEQIMAHNAGARPQFGSNLENLIPDPAIYKFETGTGYEIRPVIQPDGQAVVFGFNYMYTTQIREPVRADEKRLGRVKRHFINTDVQLSNFELREVSRYTVALKASRTSRGVPMLENIPIAGVLFRPLPSAESSLQQNLIYSQATIFPTLFDLMGLRWATAVADLDPLGVTNREFVVRGRQRALENRVYDFASEQVDEFLRIPQGNRRTDLYRSQETIPYLHPNGYQGPGLDLHDSPMQEGYRPEEVYPPSRFIPSQSPDGAIDPSGRRSAASPSTRRSTLEVLPPGEPDPRPALEPPAVQWREQ